MKLSELAYNCVKNVNHYDDDGFTYEQFLYINDPAVNDDNESDYFDYSVAVSNVFAPINEAISRLSDLDRIPYRVEEIAEENGVVNLANLLCNCKEVVNVANSNYKRLPFTPFGINKIRITRPNKLRAESIFGDNNNSNILYVEYKEDIPYFTRDDITASVDLGNDSISWDNDKDVDLREYGITDSMCNYIIEYAKGVLLEQIDAQLANMHITRAEQYFNNIRVVSSAFNQTNTTKKYNIG